MALGEISLWLKGPGGKLNTLAFCILLLQQCTVVNSCYDDQQDS